MYPESYPHATGHRSGPVRKQRRAAALRSAMRPLRGPRIGGVRARPCPERVVRMGGRAAAHTAREAVCARVVGGRPPVVEGGEARYFCRKIVTAVFACQVSGSWKR